jgi:hypothetical protein
MHPIWAICRQTVASLPLNMRPLYPILLVGVLGPVYAKHRSHIRPVDESKLPFPKGPLVWGDVNFVHTTDIHGESRSAGR